MYFMLRDYDNDSNFSTFKKEKENCLFETIDLTKLLRRELPF